MCEYMKGIATFPAHVSHRLRPGVGRVRPHRGHKPFARCSAVRVWTPRLTQAFFRSAGCMRSGAVVWPTCPGNDISVDQSVGQATQGRPALSA